MNELTFDVDGVTCGGCVATLNRVIGAVPGVREVTVALDSGRTQVRAEESVDRAAIVAAIEGAGYDVR